MEDADLEEPLNLHTPVHCSSIFSQILAVILASSRARWFCRWRPASGNEVEVDGLEGVVRKAAKASSRVRLNEQLQRECAVNVILCKPWLGAGI